MTNVNKQIGNFVLEIRTDGFYTMGHVTTETELERIKTIEARNGDDVIDKILPTEKPVIEFTVCRDLLLQILANMNGEDEEFLRVSVYGEHKPLVIRGEESFAILMPAADISDRVIDIQKAKLKTPEAV